MTRNHDSWKKLFIKHRNASRFTAALLAVKRHCEDHPDDAWAWLEYACLLIPAGRLVDAEKILARSWPASGNGLQFPLLSARINLCKAKGDIKEEERWSRELIAQMPEKSYGYVYLGCCLARQGKLADAESVLRCGTRCDDETDEVYYNLGSVLCALERFSDAKIAMETAVAMDPDYTAAKSRLLDIAACLEIESMDSPSVELQNFTSPYNK